MPKHNEPTPSHNDEVAKHAIAQAHRIAEAASPGLMAHFRQSISEETPNA